MNAPRPTDPMVEANRKLLLDRSAAGIAKYGTTLAGAGLTHKQLLQHLLEELLDAANYTQAALADADRKVLAWRMTDGQVPGPWIDAVVPAVTQMLPCYSIQYAYE